MSNIILTLIYKKGDEKDIDNYRGIALRNAVMKIFSQILHKRIYTWAEENGKLPENTSWVQIGKKLLG